MLIMQLAARRRAASLRTPRRADCVPVGRGPVSTTL